MKEENSMTLREELEKIIAGVVMGSHYSDLESVLEDDAIKRAVNIREKEKRAKDEALTAIEKLIAENYTPKNDVMEYVSEIHSLKYTAQEAYKKAVFIVVKIYNRLAAGITTGAKDEIVKELRNAFGIKEPQDSKPRECESKPDVNQAVPITPPSICPKGGQHEWEEHEEWRGCCADDIYFYSKCKKCGQRTDKPTLPDVPSKFDPDRFEDEWNGLDFYESKINDLIDRYSALKKVVEEKL